MEDHTVVWRTDKVGEHTYLSLQVGGEVEGAPCPIPEPGSRSILSSSPQHGPKANCKCGGDGAELRAHTPGQEAGFVALTTAGTRNT